MIVGPIEVELDAEQHDAVVGDELPDDDRCCDEGATDDQDPIVRAAGISDWERVEVPSELVDDRRKVDHDEVGTGRITVRAAVAAELAVEIVEEYLVETVRRLVTVRRSWRLDRRRCALRSCASSAPEALVKPC